MKRIVFLFALLAGCGSLPSPPPHIEAPKFPLGPKDNEVVRVTRVYVYPCSGPGIYFPCGDDGRRIEAAFDVCLRDHADLCEVLFAPGTYAVENVNVPDQGVYDLNGQGRATMVMGLGLNFGKDSFTTIRNFNIR